VQIDTASVLMEAIGYIKFLQDLLEVMAVKPFKFSHTTGLIWFTLQLRLRTDDKPYVQELNKKNLSMYWQMLGFPPDSSLITPCGLWAAPTWNPPEIRDLAAGQHRGYSIFYSLSDQTFISKKFKESCWPNVLCCFALWCVEPGGFKRKRWRAGGNTAWPAQQRALAWCLSRARRTWPTRIESGLHPTLGETDSCQLETQQGSASELIDG
jgi:hypothetical protein